MFNNPFDSFHNTVVESKKEREQLDRLLTISTPRERLLVVVIALLLLVLALWVVFGGVTRSLALNGVLVDGNLSEDNRSAQVLVWANSSAAQHVKEGMSALIELDLENGEADAVEGQVKTIYAVPLSRELSTLENKIPVSMRRIDLTLSESLDTSSLATRECRIIIELGRQPPITLLRAKHS